MRIDVKRTPFIHWVIAYDFDKNKAYKLGKGVGITNKVLVIMPPESFDMKDGAIMFHPVIPSEIDRILPENWTLIS